MSAYDADNLPKTGVEFSEEEKHIEAICDEERYLELHTDLAEQAVYEEEEWKRYYESLSEGYKAVGFSYDFNYGDSYPTEHDIQVKLEEEEVFIAPEELQVPVDMIQPETVKQNAIIEKTAIFIAKHGVQMEIMMKTKQSNNTQFQFLHFDDLLNPYYKHVVNMIKSGKYKPKQSAKGEVENGDSEDDHHEAFGTDGLHGYLHPSLVTGTAQPTPEVYKPITVQMPKVSIHDTPYGQLVRSFTKHHRKADEQQRLEKEGQEQSSLPPFVAQPVYGPTLPSTHSRHTMELGTVASIAQDKEIGTEETSKDSSPRDSPLTIVPPPPDVQPIIDRMAMYVAKNGIEFEIVVKSKNDPRFEFLLPHHVHYNYYEFKKNIFLKEMGKDKPKETEKVPEKEIEKETEKEIEEKSSASKGVSFSIKSKPKEQESIPLEKKKRPIFDNESSDEESRGEGESHKGEGKNKSDVSGTSTPIGNDMEPRAEVKPETVEKPEIPPEVLERKIAEQRLKDRLAAAAREKLSQADKEKQLQAERKKKAAMFINMLKSTNQQLGQGSGDPGMDIVDTGNSTPNFSRSSSPLIFEDVELELRIDEGSSKSRKRSLYCVSLSKSRSRSRSPGHKRSKKKKKRSFTPPSAYAVVRRTPPPPPRYDDVRWRDRSPISNRDRDKYHLKSRSPSKSSLKSKKSKRSKLGLSSKSSLASESLQKSSKKSKKKKKHRSSSRSHTRSPPILTRIEPILESPESVIEVPDYSVPDLTPEAVQEKQSASSSPLPQVIEEGEIADSEESLLGGGGDDENQDQEEQNWSRKSPDLLTWAKRADTPRDMSESPSACQDDENKSQNENTSPISPEMIKKVRAMIKASRQTILQEEELLDVP
ncbi:hypothetical protein CHS0354_014800 [Potamilus streckersoni]|nr:hypothetical protein CHS0354_014800 [Potamilus streckersoni]